jgi:hypothetical protein
MPNARDIPRVIIPIPRDLLHRVDEHRFSNRVPRAPQRSVSFWRRRLK